MTAPAGDPVFVLGAAISAAREEIRYLRDAIAGWEEPSDLIERCDSIAARLRAAEEIGLDVQVATTAPVEGQEVLW